MTDEDRQQIDKMRYDGYSMGEIAMTLNLSRNTVKSYCRRRDIKNSEIIRKCLYCGKPIKQNPGRKEKKFCCDSCRNKWWREHMDRVHRKAIYTFTCACCGRTFTAYGDSHRKYCSHACYIADRFGGRKCS